MSASVLMVIGSNSCTITPRYAKLSLVEFTQRYQIDSATQTDAFIRIGQTMGFVFEEDERIGGSRVVVALAPDTMLPADQDALIDTWLSKIEDLT